MLESSLHEFVVNDINHRPFELKKTKGKIVLIVNVASRCGFTYQYTDLEALYKRYKDRGLIILGFPCNQFAGQEPGDEWGMMFQVSFHL